MTSLATPPKLQFFDTNGNPLVGGKLYSYAAGTTTPLATYTDYGGGTANANPVILDSRGEANVWLSAVRYKLKLTTATNVDVWTVDNVNGADEATLAALAASGGSSLIGYLPAGAGAVATTVQTKLRESVSVKEFGAVLNGVVDDSTAVQKAFTYANGTGLRVTFPGPACKLASSILLNNYSNFVVDFGKCAVSYTSTVGVYAYDFTQAGNIEFIGGNHSGTSNLNHFVKTAGSAAAQATTYPTIPNENQWSRQLRFDVDAIVGFNRVLDLGNFTREIWIGGYITGNITALKLTGKVVNLYAMKGTTFYSGIAASQALNIRGDSGDATYRYAEGIFLAECILDTVGTSADVRDVYLLDLSGTQIKTASGGIAVDITKGVCPITRDVFLSRTLMQGKLRVGQGLASQFLFDIHGTSLAFSDVSGAAIDIQANTKGVSITEASFSNGLSTPKMFSVGAGCANIILSGLNPDTSSYVTAPTIDSTSQAGVNWLDKHSTMLVQQSGSQTIASSWTKVWLQSKVFDTDSWFDATTNYRFQPTVSGYYTFAGQVQINSTTVGLAVDLYKNGVSTGYITGVGISGVINSTIGVSKTLFLNGSTDYVELYALASTPTASNTGLVTQLSVAYVGK